GRDADVGFAGESGHFNFGAQRGLHELHRHVAEQIVAVALEDFVGLDVQDNVEIAMSATPHTGLAISRAAEARAAIHAGRDLQFDPGVLLATSRPRANLARTFDNLASTLATAAGLGDAEDAA